MTFHRKTAPTYFIAGGAPLLSGYDRINTPSDPSVGGTGSPAPADGKRSGGTNDGTYFVAFGENGISSATNRPSNALADNTDVLDDIVRTSIPVPKPLDQTTGGSPLTTVAITDEVFVGKNGTADNQANRDKIIRITDQNNNDLEVSGTKIVATLIHDGASSSVVGTRADGFRTNASVNFTPSIPASTSYRVWYGTRNSWANISLVDKSSLFGEQLRTINNISGEVRALFRQLHSEVSVNQAFDAAWDSTIRSLASAGLNERYRRATTQPAGFTSGQYNVAGDGAIILRDGKAVTVQAPLNVLSDTAMVDPDLALLKLVSAEARSTHDTYVGLSGGDIGLWHETEYRNYPADGSGTEKTRSDPMGPALVDVIPRDIRASTIGGNAVMTRISPAITDAQLNPAGAGDAANRRTIQCGTGNFFAATSPVFVTAVRCGIDMLEVVRNDGSSTLFIIESVDTATRVKVRRLNGSAADFGAVTINNIKLNWIQPTLKIGGALNQDQGSGGIFYARPLVCMPPANISVLASAEAQAPPAFFGAMTGSVSESLAGNVRARCLEWGATASPDGANPVAGSVFANGFLLGDGGIFASRAAIAGPLSATTVAGTDATFDTVSQNKPERKFQMRDDFSSGTWDGTAFLYSENTWSTTKTGSPSVSIIGGNAKNPGQLRAALATSDNWGFQLAAATAAPTRFDQIEQVTMVVNVNDNGANVATSMGMGLAQDMSAQNGGTNSLLLFYAPSSATWRLLVRKASSQSFVNLPSFVNNVFVVVRFVRNATTGDIAVFFNEVLATTVLAASVPTGGCTLGGLFISTGADAGVFTVITDFIGARGFTNARQGA